MSGCRIKWMMMSIVLVIGAGCAASQKSRRIKAANSVTPYPGEGGAVISNLRYASLDEIKTVCVAPPAQAGANVNIVVKHRGKVNVLGYAEVESDNSVEYARTLMKLHENNERTLFLQFSLYRLCEAYMNGMLEEETYAEILERRVVDAKEQQRIKSSLAQQAITAGDAIPSPETLPQQLKEAKGRREAAQERDQLFEYFAKKGVGSVEELRVSAKAWTPDEQAKKAIVLDRDGKALGKSVTALDKEIADLGEKQQIVNAAVQARAATQSITKEIDYLVAVATDARTEENKVRKQMEDMTPEARDRAWQRLSRKNYMRLFSQIMETAEHLAQTQAEIARADAERAKAEAEKAKIDAAKAAGNDALKKAEEELKQLKGQLIDATVKRITGTDDTKTSETKTETRTESRK